MRWLAILALLAWQGCAWAQSFATAPAALEPPLPDLEGDRPQQPRGVTDAVIRQAVRATIAEDPRPPPAQGAAALSGGATQARLNAAFEQAKVPDCLHSDALKHQPAHIGPIAVVGIYSLPWVVTALLRGKCN